MDMNWYTGFAVIISTIALLLSLLAYVYRITPSLSAYFETKVNKILSINYGGNTPLFAGELYLDLFLINYGVGIAKDIKWQLTIEGYESTNFPLTGQLSFLQPNVPTNVQRFLKIETKNRSKAEEEWKKNHPEASLENDQESLKEIVHKKKNIPKYVLNLEYSALLPFCMSKIRKKRITLQFDEEGSFVSAKMTK